MPIWTPPPLRQRLRRPRSVNEQRGWIMAPYRYAGTPPGDEDPYWANVVLLVDASARSDGSTPGDIDVTGKTPTWRGNAQCKTDQYKFGTSSLYFDGTNDRVSFADSVDFTFGSGDFTVECWARPSDNGRRYVLSQANSYSGFYSVQIERANGIDKYGRWAVTDGSTTRGGTSANNTFLQDAWSHLAISRVGDDIYRCINGSAATFSTTAFTLMDSTGPFTIGAYYDADSAYQWKGWIDQVRVTKGVGRYAGAYSVPTAKFPHG